MKVKAFVAHADTIRIPAEDEHRSWSHCCVTAYLRCGIFIDAPGMQPITQIGKERFNLAAERDLPSVFVLGHTHLPAWVCLVVEVVPKSRSVAS